MPEKIHLWTEEDLHFYPQILERNQIRKATIPLTKYLVFGPLLYPFLLLCTNLIPNFTFLLTFFLFPVI